MQPNALVAPNSEASAATLTIRARRGIPRAGTMPRLALSVNDLKVPGALDRYAPGLALDDGHLLARGDGAEAIAGLRDPRPVEPGPQGPDPDREVALVVGLNASERPIHRALAAALNLDGLDAHALRRGGERLERAAQRDPPPALHALAAGRDLEPAADHRPRRRPGRPARAGATGRA